MLKGNLEMTNDNEEFDHDRAYQERKEGEIQRYYCNVCGWRTCHISKPHITFCKCDEGLDDDWRPEK